MVKLYFKPDQPPSGGCVLKQILLGLGVSLVSPAAFGRLRVETSENLLLHMGVIASRLRAAAC